MRVGLFIALFSEFPPEFIWQVQAHSTSVHPHHVIALILSWQTEC